MRRVSGQVPPRTRSLPLPVGRIQTPTILAAALSTISNRSAAYNAANSDRSAR
jgi:hypothetical protein